MNADPPASESHIRFIAFHPRLSFTATQNRLRLHVTFEKYEALWRALGHDCAAALGMALAGDALDTMKRDGFSEREGDRLSCALLYITWLIDPRKFQTVYGVMAGYDSKDEASIGGFSEDRWQGAVDEAKRRGFA